MYIKVDNQQSVEDFKSNTIKGKWIILYYASWCPHCQTMKPEWEKFANKYSSNNSDVNVADVESEFLEKVGPEHKSNVVGFPTIVSCKNGRKITDFNGPRTSDEIDKFANSTDLGMQNVNSNNQNQNQIQKNNTQALLNTILKIGKPQKMGKAKKTKKSKTTKKTKKTKKSVKGKKSKSSKKSKKSSK
jgi:hypothetical protein